MRGKTVRRWIAWVMTLALVFACAGCGEKTPDDPTDASQTEPVDDTAQIRYNDLRLAYARGDKLDPFLCKTTVNRQLTTLLYDSLFVVDEHFEAKPLLAKEYSTDGLSVTVSVNEEVRFTDGTYMTMADVVYSFEQAKEADAFKARLKNFESASAVGPNILLFTLESPDPYAVACLDFPIIKTGTSAEDRKKAAEEAPQDAETPKTTDQVVPVGGGRYMLQYEEGENDPVLVAFNDRFRGFFPPMSVIRLVNVTDSSALFYSLEIGNISFAFDDLSGGKYTRVNATISEYPMNNLVYVGMNQDDPALANTFVRKAISYAIDRQDVLNVAFQGHATVTRTPFNPLWTPAAEYETSHSDADPDALKLLEANGFDKINTYGVRNNGRISLSFDMLVVEDNDFKRMAAQQIAKKLGTMNIKVNITTLPRQDFLNAVELGKFDLYIGEVSLTPNMNLDVFLGGSGAAAHGIWNKSAADAYHGFLSGEMNFDAFMEAFNDDMPFIPLCYRKGIVASVKELQGTQQAFVGDLFADIEEWHF